MNDKFESADGHVVTFDELREDDLPSLFKSSMTLCVKESTFIE